jgi:hypothetical protein
MIIYNELHHSLGIGRSCETSQVAESRNCQARFTAAPDRSSEHFLTRFDGGNWTALLSMVRLSVGMPMFRNPLSVAYRTKSLRDASNEEPIILSGRVLALVDWRLLASRGACGYICTQTQYSKS